jgi:phosphoribosylanthranilate isomerase
VQADTLELTMGIWIKICGNTSLEDARLAAEAGADAVGFVFAPSPRRVTVEQAAGIAAGLPGEIEKIGVFVGAGFEQIEPAVTAAGLTGVQLLHSASLGTNGAELTARLKERFGEGLRVLQVVHFGPGAEHNAAEQARVIFEDSNVDAVLVDSRTATAVGGTGVAFDWADAARTVFQSAKGLKPMVAAGGLSPANVAEAIATMRPWGVDVVSGVESAPGCKDAAKVRAFVANARRAH